MGCCSLSFFFLAGYFGEAFQPSRPRPYATFVQCASRFFLSLVPYVEKSVREHWFALSSFFFSDRMSVHFSICFTCLILCSLFKRMFRRSFTRHSSRIGFLGSALLDFISLLYTSKRPPVFQIRYQFLLSFCFLYFSAWMY